MSLDLNPPRQTSAARLAANARNAALSTGPRTAAGKARSALNALQHGLRARARILPDEDAGEYQRRHEEFAQALGPTDAVENELVTRAVTATWYLDRAQSQELATLVDRRARAVDEHDLATAADIQRARSEFDEAPAVALVRFGRSVEGCRWVADRWERLRDQLEEIGEWNLRQLDVALRLLGIRPAERFDDPLGARVCQLALALPKQGPTGGQGPAESSTAESEPPSVAQVATHGPAPEEARAELSELVIAELAHWRQRQEERAECEVLARELAVERASLDESPAGALRLRYVAHHERVFRGALRALDDRRANPARREDEAPLPAAARSVPTLPSATLPSPPLLLPPLRADADLATLSAPPDIPVPAQASPAPAKSPPVPRDVPMSQSDQIHRLCAALGLNRRVAPNEPKPATAPTAPQPPKERPDTPRRPRSHRAAAPLKARKGPRRPF